MAMQKIEIELNVDAKTGIASIKYASDEMKRFEDAVRQTNTSTTAMQQSFVEAFKNMKNVGLGFGEAMNMVTSVFGKGVAKAMEYELSIAKLKGVIESGGKESEVAVAQLEKFAGVMSRNGMISKKDALDIERYFLTFRNIGGASVQKATEAVIGLKEALDLGDARSATIALARALDQGSEGMRSLNKMGLKLQKDELDHVKALESQGKTYEMQTYIIDILSNKYQSLSESIKGTAAFTQNQMQKALSGFQKESGMLILEGLHPLIVSFNDLLGLINKLPGPVKGTIALTAQLTLAMGLLKTTGIGEAIMKMLQMGPTLNTYRLKAAEAAIATKGLTAAQEEQALASWYAASANKGFFASLGPIGWALIGITALGTAYGMFRDNVVSAFESLSEEEKQLEREKVAFGQLAARVKDTTLSIDERKRALADITEKYPGYLQQKDLDLSNEKQLNDAIARGNRLYDERIKMKGMEKQLEKKADEIAALKVANIALAKEKKSASAVPAQGEGSEFQAVYVGQLSDEIANNINKIKTLEEEYQSISGEMKPNSGSSSTDPKAEAQALLVKSTGGLTNEAVSNFVQELQAVDAKLQAGSELSKKVRTKIEQIQGDSRFGKTGGHASSYLQEDVKLDLSNITEMNKLLDAFNVKWKEIDTLTVKGNATATSEKRQKARYQLRDIFEKSMDDLIKQQVAGGEADVAGGDNMAKLQAKLQALQQSYGMLEKLQQDWDAKHGDFPVVSKQKLQQVATEIKKVQGDIGKEVFNRESDLLESEATIWDKQLDVEHASDMERLAWKEQYYQAQLLLAEDYGQQDKAATARRNLEMLQLEKKALAEKMQSAERGAVYDIGISRANRNYAASGKSSYALQADELGELRAFENEKTKIQDDALLSEQSKKALLEELEQAHNARLLDIKRKYYDTWLGELLGFGKAEIDTVGRITDQMQGMFSSIYEMQSNAGKKEADAYRKTEYDKLEADKKAELAKAHTEKQKNAIEEKYAKRKEQIDEEANRRGQERARSMFLLMKAMQIAQAIINTYSAATAALAPPPIGAGPVLGPILAGATILAGLANVAVISQQEMPKMAQGGRVKGRGTGTSDSVPTMLSDGEFVMPASVTAKELPLLERLRSGSSSAREVQRANIVYLQQGGADMSGVVAAVQRVEGAVADLHAGLATGGIHAKVTSRTAAQIASAGIGRLKRRGAG